MKFFGDIKKGIIAYYRSFGFVFVNNLWFFFFFPALIIIALYFAGDAIREDLYTVDFQSIARDDYYSLLIVGLKAVFVFIAFKLNKVVLLIVLSPVLALLSAKTERILDGNRYPFDFTQFIKDINRGISIAVRNAMIQLLFIVLWLSFCVFIHALLDFTGWFIFAIGFYFYGFSLIDYVNERRRLNMEDSTRFIREHAGLTIITGGIFSAILLIPYAGLIIAPVTGVVAATIGVDMIVDLKTNVHAVKVKE